MAGYITEAILLGAKNWGEADKLLHFFSRERGRIRAVAFGCRRPKSPLAGAMQMFSVMELSLTPGTRLDTVRQASVRRRFPHLAEDLLAMAYASFVAELVLELEPEAAANPLLYDWLTDVFAAFQAHNPRLTALASGYRMLDFAGVGFKYETCAKCDAALGGEGFFSAVDGGALCSACGPRHPAARPLSDSLRRLFLNLTGLDWKAPASFRVRGQDMMAAEDVLLASLRQLLGKDLKSLRFIRQMSAVDHEGVKSS